MIGVLFFRRLAEYFSDSWRHWILQPLRRPKNKPVGHRFRPLHLRNRTGDTPFRRFLQNNDLVHRNPEQMAQRTEIVHRRQAVTLLPPVNCLRAPQAQVLLKGRHTDVAFFAELLDVLPRLVHINNRIRKLRWYPKKEFIGISPAIKSPFYHKSSYWSVGYFLANDGAYDIYAAVPVDKLGPDPEPVVISELPSTRSLDSIIADVEKTR